MKKVRLAALALAAALLVAACGGGDDDGGSGGGGGGDGEGLSIDQVKLAIDNDDYMNQLAWMIADDKYWPKLGFTKPAEVVASDEYIAGLVGGTVWIAQGESDVIWDVAKTIPNICLRPGTQCCQITILTSFGWKVA